MDNLFNPDIYWSIVATMACLAVAVFFALQRITAGYGMMYDRRWGPTVGNRLGWVLMEAPVFIAMLALWILSPRKAEALPPQWPSSSFCIISSGLSSSRCSSGGKAACRSR